MALGCEKVCALSVGYAGVQGSTGSSAIWLTDVAMSECRERRSTRIELLCERRSYTDPYYSFRRLWSGESRTNYQRWCRCTES